MEVSFSCLPKDLPIRNQYHVPFPRQFFKLPTTMAFVGPRGSGKTFSATLFNKWHIDNGYFTRIFIISPTFDSNPEMKEHLPIRPQDVYNDIAAGWEAIEDVEKKVIADAEWYKRVTKVYTPLYKKAIKEGYNSLSKEEKKDLEAMQKEIEDFYTAFLEEMKEMLPCPANEQILEGMIFPSKPRAFYTILGNEYEEELEEQNIEDSLFPPPSLPHPCPLLFIDDMSHSPIYGSSPNNPLINLTLRHRHLGGKGYGVSIQFAVQTFKAGIQRALRQNTMQFCLFKTNAVEVLDDIYQELGAFTTRKGFQQMYERAIEDPHDFLLVDVNPSDRKRVFRQGFEKILLLPSSSTIDTNDPPINLKKKRKKIENPVDGDDESDSIN